MIDKTRICERCEHYEAWDCNHPQAMQWSPVHGEFADHATLVRDKNGACGPEGRLWEQRKPRRWEAVAFVVPVLVLVLLLWMALR